MIQHPEVWTRVRNEIDDAQAKGLCLGCVVSFHDAEKLQYLRACIKEALRLFSPTTMGLPRMAPKDGITIADRHFQEGTILSVSSQLVHRIAGPLPPRLTPSSVVHSSESIWGADAHQWNPERWMSEDAKELEKNWLVVSLLWDLSES